MLWITVKINPAFYFYETFTSIKCKNFVLQIISFHSDVTKINSVEQSYLIRSLSPLTLWVWILLRWGVLDTTLCDKFFQWLLAGQCFFPVSSTNKTDGYDITEILLKGALNTIPLTLTLSYQEYQYNLTSTGTSIELGHVNWYPWQGPQDPCNDKKDFMP